MKAHFSLFSALRWHIQIYASIIFCLLFLSSLSYAEDFFVRNVADYGNVTVMEVTGNYDENNPDGTANVVPRQLIAKEFFKTHKDEYDTLVIFTNFDFRLAVKNELAFYTHVKNDVRGIGKQIFDNSALYGSNGKLQGTIDMGNVAALGSSPTDPQFGTALDMLAHEMLHRWSAYVRFKDADGNISKALLGDEQAHWSYLLDTKGSIQYGNQWRDNGNGTFTSVSAPKYYSPLDLYLMGMIDKSKVPPMLLIENPAIDPTKLPELGATITGTPRYVTIDDIIAAEGERIPNAKDSQKQFKMAFIFVTTPGTFTGQELDGIENIRNGFLTRYSILTDGQGLIQVASTPKEGLPVNPGVRPPSTAPRTLPPNIDDGVKWLLSHQQNDGSWTDFALTTERDTAEVVTTLQRFPVAQQQFQTGLAWLGSSAPANTDFLSRRLEATVQAGGDSGTLAQELLARRNPDGGWGSGRSFISNPTDTALAVKALAKAGYADQQVVSRAIAYLKSAQNSDGGWSGGDTVSTIQSTAAVLTAFNAYRKSFSLESQIAQATAFLAGKQNPDGGFGNSPSTVYDSALTAMALQEASADKAIVNSGLNYLMGLQAENGSWQDSPFQTALAIRAVWQATVDPDLAIKTTDISFIPEKVTSLPTNAVVNAVIWNLGRNDVPQAKVAIYDGAIAPEKKVAEQTVAFPGQSSVTVTFPVPVADGNGHYFHVVVDPDNVVKEANENNNGAAQALLPESTYDFEALSADLTVSPNPVDIYQEMRINAKIANTGTMTAYNVPVRFFIDEPGAPFEIATVTVDIPAGGTVVKEITWKANKAGVNLPLTVQVDPNNTIAELSKSNNVTSTSITVNSLILTGPNLSLSYKDIIITPNPTNEGGKATISAIVLNTGNAEASNVKVNFYRGVPGKDSLLIGTQTIAVLSPSTSETVSVEWDAINEAGTKIVYVQVDSENTVKELAEDDNDAYSTLYIRSLADFAVSANSILVTPGAPKDGDVVSITVAVQNRGEQDAANVAVQLKEGNTVVGAFVIPVITGNSTGTGAFTFDTAGRTGILELTAVIDPDNLIVEQHKGNNSATKTLGVQNSRLWVSEPYFSPNGDGIKDTTQMFFRLDAPTSVKVMVVDAQGQTVRTFKDGELVDGSGTVVTWDGRTEEGSVTKDGQYKVQIRDLNNTIIGSVAVVVDNNRSPLKEAIWSNDLFKNDIGCQAVGAASPGRSFWLDDESGYVVGGPDKMWYFPMNGEEPNSKNKNDEWFRYIFSYPVNKAKISYSSVTTSWWDYRIKDYLFYAWDNEYGYENKYYVYSVGYTNQVDIVTGELWSDDRNNIAIYSSGRSNWYDAYGKLFVINMSGGGNNIHEVSSTGYSGYLVNLKTYSKLAWSPNSSKLAYWDPTSFEVVITDSSGANKSTVYSAADVLVVKWVDNDTLLAGRAVDNGTTLLINANDKTTSLLTKGALLPVLSNDRTKVLLKLSSAAANIVGLDGTVIAKINSPAYGTPLWSPTDRYVALQQSVATDNDTIVIFDMQTNEYHKIDRVYTGSAVWYDDDSLLYSRFDNGIALYDLKKKTTKILDSGSRSRISISPFKNYLTWWGGINYSCSKNSTFLVSSRLNLSAAVRAVNKGQSLLITGTATDANFGGWKLEYSDRSTPGTWNLVAPPSDAPVIDGIFTSWVPPGEGIYEIRLTAWDKAGNTAVTRETVTWSNRTGISNIYKNLDAISPNGDGVNDSLEVHYSLPIPRHVDYSVYDSSGTLTKSGYAAPGTEYIAWDGRDETGRVVPDGKYKIKVFDSELYFDVDNKPPVTSAVLTPISKDKDTGLWYADLIALANDINIKNWIVEYAEGENPGEGLAFKQGNNIVAKKDENGNFLSPMAGEMIARFSGQDLGWLKGKKFRITAEDFAGNKSSSTTDFIKEKVFLSSWDHSVTLDDDYIPPEMAKPGSHSIGGAETLRLPVVTTVLQYWNGKEWSDVANTADTGSGRIDFTWDNSSAGGGVGFAVRAKVQDVLGAVHYSNVLSTKSLFALDANCYLQLLGQNSLFEELSLLKIQTRAPNAQWTDHKVYDSSKGDVVPMGLFIEQSPDLASGTEIRMTGVGTSGKTYETVPAPYPPKCPVKFKLLVNYEDAKECGEINPGRVTLSGQITDSAGSVVLQNLSYYMQKQDGIELLRSFDMSFEGWKSHLLVTADIAEGVYPVKAVLSYLDQEDMKVKVAEAVASVTVDRSPPVVEITHPQPGLLTTCPVIYSGLAGDWYGIPVEGTVNDNVRAQKSDLFYGIGEQPTTWLPAGGPAGQPITGYGAKQGTIGVWNVSSLKEATYSLKLQVKDETGNLSCATTSVSFDKIVDLPAISLGRTLFSPNNDGASDDLNITFDLNEYALFDAKVFRLRDNSTLDTATVRTMVSGMKHFPGSENLLWDGKADGGWTVPDGRYGVAVSVSDICGNSMTRWAPVEIDVTPPIAAITYPRPGDTLPSGNIVEVKGVATDAHFQEFILEAGQGDTPSAWIVVGSGSMPVSGNILGAWNTFGLEGTWMLRLTSIDKAGNKSSVTSTVDLGTRSGLIKSVTISPISISPNADSKKDTAAITYEMTTSCQTDITITDLNGAVVKTISLPSGSVGTFSYTWDGKNNSGAVVPDGYYKVKVHAALLSDNTVTQTEEITVGIDTTPPSINISAPAGDSYLKTSGLDITGSISDENLTEYNLKVTGPSGVLLQRSGSQNRAAYTFGTLNELPEDTYSLNSDAKDTAENMNTLTRVFTIDRTPPKVTLDAPTNGDYFGSTKPIINFVGSIVEKNLETYGLKIGSGENPSEWRELAGGTAVPSLSSWPILRTGKDDGISDGIYTIWLYAKDKATLEGEARAKVVVDNTPPDVAITSISSGEYIKGPIDIVGTAFDANFDRGLLEISEGYCSTAFKWTTLKVLISPFKNELIYSWKLLPSDGVYCLRFSAMDKTGGKTEVLLPVEVHAQPPPAPVLSGKVDSKTTVNLNWTSGKESGSPGFNIYRNGQKLNTAPMSANTYNDTALKEGTYAYSIKAVDTAGNESLPSNVITLIIDLTGPTVRMISPMQGARVTDIVDVKGTAFSDDFKQYTLYVGQGPSPSSWSEIKSSTVPVPSGSLGQLDTHSLVEGVYAVKLEAEDSNGNMSVQQQTLTVDKTPLSSPVLLSATAVGSNVSVVWKSNPETDLAGYLLMRNGQLVNGAGMSFRDITPFLLSGATYSETLSDGEYEYLLVAVDSAGNISGLSNKLSINIDIRPPHADIVDPASGIKFEGKIRLKAGSPDNDIISLQFQFKKTQESGWTNIGAPLTGGELVAYFDPNSYGLPYGDCQLRAVATDSGGKTDPAPVDITVTYTDLTAPDSPSGLHQLTDGDRIALSWDQNFENDLAGYNIYRTSGTVRTKLNSIPIKPNHYSDENVGDGLYIYEIAAIDIFSNESKASSAVSAKIYAPVLTQPITPVDHPNITVSGTNADPGSTVEFFVETGQAQVSLGKTNADEVGEFSLENLQLFIGANKITARASDSTGNTSRFTGAVVVLYSLLPPVPAGVAVSVEGHDVSLIWQPNPEADVIGYNVYRDTHKVNAPIPVTTGLVTASSDYYYSPSSGRAFDGNPSTFWLSGTSYQKLTPTWWEVDLQSPAAVSRLEVHWCYGYSGKDYEIQALVDNQWLTVKTIVGNTQNDTTYNIYPSVKTQKIRLYITDTNQQYIYKQIGITEVTIIKEQLVTLPSYLDRNVPDGRFRYKISAVNSAGFEGPSSDEMLAEVGDVVPPAVPQGLVSTISGSTAILSWLPNGEPDIAGYYIFIKTTNGWTRLNSALITGTSFSDQNLLNGLYFYRIAAVDTVGNESVPSSEVSATIAVMIPLPPHNLKIASVPEGKMLNIQWEASGGPVVAYNLYRGITSGGPYQKVNMNPLLALTHLDTGLSNGTNYFYVTTAIDSLGNESVYSTEVSGIPADVVPPVQPLLFFPASPGIPALRYQDTADIIGITEPGATVELFKGNMSVSKTKAYEADLVQTMQVSRPDSLSPDGTYLVYDSTSPKIKNLLTGAITGIPYGGWQSVWSPYGTKFAYQYYDGYWHIRILDLNTNIDSSLTSDGAYVNERHPYWSRDGGKIAFTSNRAGFQDVWVKDVSSGSLTQITNGLTASYPTLSPDGKQISYFKSKNLYIFDLASGATIQIDTNTDSRSLEWSPDGKSIAFVSYKNGSSNIYVMNMETRALQQVTNSPNAKSYPKWSPSGREIAYITYEQDRTNSLNITGIGGEGRLILGKLDSFLTLDWTKSGGLSCIMRYANAIKSVYIKGMFAFKDVGIDPGENILKSIAGDDSTNLSPQSDEITVVYDTSLIPDLTVRSDDILAYPPYPKPGEEVLIHAVIKNPRNIAVDNVEVDLYVWDSDGDLKLVKSETIPRLAANSEETVSVSINAVSQTGLNSVIMVVDPANKIEELLESNNYATKEFYVTDKQEVIVTTALEYSEYAGNQDAEVTVTLRNSGMVKDGVLNVGIEDGNGNNVALLASVSTVVSYGTDNYSYRWNTGVTFAGSYRVHAVFSGADGAMTESSAPFTILPDVRIDSGVVTDKEKYGANENVAVTLHLKNSGSNYVVPLLTVRTRIVDSLNTTQFAEEKTAQNLYPAMAMDLNTHWITGLHEPGEYRVIFEVYLGDRLASSSSASFTINPVSAVRGTVTVEPATILAGNNLKAAFTLTNVGNIDTSGVVRAVIIYPASQTTVADAEQTVTLAMNGSRTGEFTFPTQGFELKPYLLTLQFVSQGSPKSIASSSFTVRDGTPPVITTISPLASTTYNSLIPIAAFASDNASGVEKVEYQLDGGTWKLLPLADPARGRYAAAWEPTIVDNGPHIISFRASDRAGNESTSVPVSFDIQMDNVPPVTTITVGAPQYEANGKLYVSSATQFTLTATDNFSGAAKSEYRIDGSEWLPYVPFVLTMEGEHLISYRSVDNAGNPEEEKTLIIILDKTPPQSVITASDPLAEEGVNTVSPATTFTLTASDNLAGVKEIWYRIDGGQWQLYSEGFTLTGLKAGTHTISFNASDNVGNDEAERSVTVRLILADVKKEISIEPVVLVGTWTDNLNKVKNQSAIDALRLILSSHGTSYHIAENGDDFKSSLRSGRYTTYLLVDYKDETVGGEIREVINYGDNLIFIKTRPSADPILDEVLGVKFTGKTTSDNLTVTLPESPLSEITTLQSSGKSVVADILPDTVKVFGYVTDKSSQYPSLIFNEYGSGKVVLFTFDLLNSADKEKVFSLIANSIALLKPELHKVRALDSVPLRITASSSTEPLDIQVTETIPIGTGADAIIPHGIAADMTITWQQLLDASTKAEFGYYLNLPDAKGEYTATADVRYANFGNFRLYETAQLTVNVQNDSAELLQGVIAELNQIPVSGSNDLVIVIDSVSMLSKITVNALDVKEAERNIETVTKVSKLIRGLLTDTAEIRLKLDELLKILQKKWCLLRLPVK